jgi:3-methyladenine DNA glycosylase AlkD
MKSKDIVDKIKSLKNPKNIAGMARFGIRPKAQAYGIPLPVIRQMAKEIKKDHGLAISLFKSGIHEAKILATIIAEQDKLTEREIESWIRLFDSWDIVDQCCMNLFWQSKICRKKIIEWAKSEEEFIRRTAFSLMAALAVKDKEMKDADFLKFFPLIKKYATDERNFVKKSVNWALRQIGKRNKKLNKEAVKLAQEIRQIGQKKNSKAAKWVASNALSELLSPKYQAKLK